MLKNMFPLPKHLLICIIILFSNHLLALDEQQNQKKESNYMSNDDPFLWLEEVEGKQSLAWVKQQNKLSQTKLESYNKYQKYYTDALAILNSEEKLPYVSFRGKFLYNFQTDKNHQRGLWRRTNLKEYKKENTSWENIINFDILAKTENKNWVYKGVTCLAPEYDKCLIQLSDGGKDASVYREYSISNKQFVKNGFYIPEAKSGVEWIDNDHLLIGTNWGENSLTASGYPKDVKILTRGQKLNQAQLIYSGETKDVGVWPYIHHGEKTNYKIIIRAKTFFESMYLLLNENNKAEKIDIAKKIDLNGILNDDLIITLNEKWHNFATGSLIAFNLKSKKSSLILAPKKGAAVKNVRITKNQIAIELLENVVGKIVIIKNTKHGWQHHPIKLKSNGVVSIVSGDKSSDQLLIEYESPTSPSTIYYSKGGKKTKALKSSPSWFNTKGIVTKQKFATSKDGTKIPYFIIGKKDVLKKGNAPTHLYAYGGFSISILPTYSGLTGKLWLENGGVYVIANIRGGGEYGPNWHDAALKENRQNAYDDFFAVAEKLISTKLTSAQKLVTSGGSNGGLLMGVALTQRSDLFSAIFCAVPLLDMLRFNKLLAGASWVGEYGNPDNPQERKYILKYSPYQNLVKGKDYTDIFFYTSTKDDRVHPGHARKMAAKMQSYDMPFTYYENTEGGHAGAANNIQTAKRYALQYSFFMQQLDSKKSKESKNQPTNKNSSTK